MFVFSLGALVFGGWVAWEVGKDYRDNAADFNWQDHLADIGAGAGALCVIVTALRTLF